MMLSKLPQRVQLLKQKFTTSLGLPFKDLLTESTIQQALSDEKIKYRQRLFDPIVTLWAFLSQVLDVDKSCHNTVSRVIAWLATENLSIPSSDTSAYCQARKRLPESLLQRLFKLVADQLENKIQPNEFWCHRHVKVIDTSTVSMTDTIENQTAYPQPSSQSPGCGFPSAKIGVLFSLVTGAALAIAIDTIKIPDVKFARKLYEFIKTGDILVGDRAFCSYADIAFIKNRKADVVFRKNQTREDNERRRIRRVGPADQIVTWQKPKSRPKGLKRQEFASLPKEIVMREVLYYINIKGFRTKKVRVITTLLDPIEYPIEAIIDFYQARWEVELDLKHLKTTLGMEHLRSKTPAMVRKELYAYFLAYNLLRTLMCEAVTTHGVEPLALSLQGTRHHLNNFIPELAAASHKKRQQLYFTLLQLIIHKPVPYRPGRSEPRVRKRRPKSYPLMQQPRDVLRRQLA